MIYVLNYAQISGLKTLGENIADLGGVNLAYHVRFQAFYDYLFQQWQKFSKSEEGWVLFGPSPHCPQYKNKITHERETSMNI